MSFSSINKLTLPISHVMDDQDDDVDGPEDDDIETSPLDYKTPEELMSPLERVSKTYSSDNMLERENIAKELGEASSHIRPEQFEEVKAFIEIIHTLAQDPEIYVRQIVAEQIAGVLQGLQLAAENSDEYLTLLDVLVQFCSDTDQKVRHNNHSSILSLISETKYKDDITRLSCDTIKKLSSKDSPFQIKADAILLLSRIVASIDSQLLVEEFSDLFTDFTYDTMHDVRRAFAYACRDLCPVLGTAHTEKCIVPLFVHLCLDDFWSVRKACCEVFDKVSASCSEATRSVDLTEHFLKLLADNSRWVRKAAFESLGPFLSTFYNPNKEVLDDQSADIEGEPADTESAEVSSGDGQEEIDIIITDTDVLPEATEIQETQDDTPDAENEVGNDTFSNFLYWRDPVPPLGESELKDILELSLANNKDEHRDDLLEDPFGEREEEIPDQSWDYGKCLRQADDTDMSLELIDEPIPPLVYQQIRVPSKLLVEYLLMTDQKKIQHVDTDLPMKCAYSFPGVAMTLGRENWNCLKMLYINLASELQWKIRRCLACSLHCLAQIYGPEITSTDLLSVFDTFLKDIDEVKSGVISHIGEFLEILPRDICLKYGPSIPILKNPDNKNNWRYRLSFTEQLIPLVKQFPLEKSIEYFQPLMLELGHDPVAEVRDAASKILVFMLNYVQEVDSGQYFDRLIELIISHFAHQTKWLHRLQFVKTCQLILETGDGNISMEIFSEKLMRDLLTLAKDKVPNVRLTTGHLLFKIFNSEEWMKEIDNTAGLTRTIEQLKQDFDQDVRGSVGEERCVERAKNSTGMDMIKSSLSLVKDEICTNITLTDSLNLMYIHAKERAETEDGEVMGEMELDDNSSVPAIVFPDSTTNQLEDLEGLNVPIGDDDVIELYKFGTHSDLSQGYDTSSSYPEIDMDIETMEDNAISQEPPADPLSTETPKAPIFATDTHTS